MAWPRFPLVLLVLLVLPANTACGENVAGTEPEPTGDVWTDEVTPPDGGETTEGPETTSEVAPEEDGAGDDSDDPEDSAEDDSSTGGGAVSACINPGDLTIIHGADTDIQGDTGAFGQSCMGRPDMTACTTAKLLEKHGLTLACGTCFAEALTCIVENCLLKCGADPSSDTCACCQQAQGCTPDFYTCSGLPSDDPVDCDG